ncbi:MAG: prephenate dehydrogenase/arogenate dehydrogenase family protein [bacterium]|nr:prephenate dehydrogenase/arogenate dehydrogenase family protein [bacterium]
MQQLQDNFKIGIYSLGLIGGSLYKALSKVGGAELFACTSNDETLSLLNENASKSPEILADCDLIFVCSPISQTVNVIKKLFAINKTALYVDVASLKNDIVSEIGGINGCRFLGSHPMAGTENSGYKASFAELFEGAAWVLTPTDKTQNDDIKLLELIITLVGAFPIVMDAQEHDKATALISHLPMLISQSLVLSAKDNNSALKLASSGFRDTTRLALSNKVMAKDMLVINKDNIRHALEDVVNNAQKLLDQDYFDNNIDGIISTRANLYNSSGKNNFRNNE